MSENIRNTMLTPGWTEIVEKAKRRIKENSLLVTATRDEAAALQWHRATWAAIDGLEEFLQELQDEPKESE